MRAYLNITAMIDPQIEQYIVLSTAHLKQKTVTSLLEMPSLGDPLEPFLYFPLRYASHENGFVFFIPQYSLGQYDDILFEYDMHELVPIVEYAQENNFTMVNFDRSAKETDLFHVYRKIL